MVSVRVVSDFTLDSQVLTLHELCKQKIYWLLYVLFVFQLFFLSWTLGDSGWCGAGEGVSCKVNFYLRPTI